MANRFSIPNLSNAAGGDSEKKKWLKKTRNSPAAKSGAFSDDERWAKHQASQKKKKTSTDKPKKAGPAMGRGIKVKPRNQVKKTTNREKVGLFKQVSRYFSK